MTRILLDIKDEARRHAFASALESIAGQLATDLSQLNGELPEIVVTDSAESYSQFDRRSRPGGQPFALVAIGWEGPAEVVLPHDALPREVATACGLLTEIARLRREGSDRHRETGEMRYLAFTDPLTGIANRRAWDEEVDKRFSGPMDRKRNLTLALVDLDKFKNVNDQYGHGTGDEVLRDAARAISASVRASDFVARMGGDEFGLLLADVELATAASVVERLRRSIATRCSRAAGPRISASVGYSTRQHNEPFANLFERADQALRKAKSSGRDCAIGNGGGAEERRGE